MLWFLFFYSVVYRSRWMKIFIYNKLVKFVSIFYKIRAKLPPEIFRLIYFAFVHSHLSYGIVICGYTTANHLSKLIVLNNRLLHILQHKPFKTHTTDLYNTLLSHYSCCIVIRFWSSFIGTFIIEMNCLPYFLHILRKRNLFTIMTHDINTIFMLILYVLNLAKEVSNIRVVNFGIIYLRILKP